MKILNLYCGIGGNRKLWGDEHEVTAIEINPEIAKVYQYFFPNDKVVIGDAHQFLLEHFEEFDFIWSSPPCPTHSKIRRFSAVERGQNKPVFPDMKLYEEIIFLTSYFKGEFVVENVVGFYEPLIRPFECGQHYYWSSFVISNLKLKSRMHNGSIEELEKLKGFSGTDWGKFKVDKRIVLRNCVEPEIALKIFKMAFKNRQQTLSNLSPTSQTKSLRDFPNREHNMGDKVSASPTPKCPSDTSHHPNIMFNKLKMLPSDSKWKTI